MNIRKVYFALILLQSTHRQLKTHTPSSSRGLSSPPVPAGVSNTFESEGEEQVLGLGWDGMG